MFSLSKIDRHAELMNRMADTVGADFSRAIVSGAMSGEQYRQAILSCTNCSHPEECASWLEANPGGAEQTPEYCRNAGLFDRLARND